MTDVSGRSDADLLGPGGPVTSDVLDAVDAAVVRVLGEGAELGDGQRDAVLGALVDDCLAVLPPAAGKSAVYAVTGLVLGGPTVVVSPTLALHRDQVAHLVDAGLRADVLNSTLAKGRRGGCSTRSARVASTSSSPRPSSSRAPTSSTCWRRARRRCSRSTRCTASATGDRTSAPTT